jgi:hypothetical protein
VGTSQPRTMTLAPGQMYPVIRDGTDPAIRDRAASDRDPGNRSINRSVGNTDIHVIHIAITLNTYVMHVICAC